MILENKYNVPRETIKKMVSDGIISTSVVYHYEVLDMFQRFKNECPACPKVDLLQKVADERKEPFERIKKIVYELGKNS